MNDFLFILPILARKAAFGIVIIFLTVSNLPISVAAQDRDRQYMPREILMVNQGARVTMGDAMGMVQQRTGGRVVSAQNIKQDGREAYRIKVLTRSGEIKIFVVDAQSGSIHQD